MSALQNLTDKFTEVKDQTLEKLKDQEFYQQLQGSYEQLPPEQQNYVKWGSVAGVAILCLYFALGAYQNASSLKSEYFDKQDLLQVVNQSGDEMRRLKGQNSGFTQSASQQNWKSVLESAVTNQGLPADSIELLKETPGAAQSMIQESLLEAQVKNVPVRTLVQILFQLEHGTPPIKLKGISTDTGSDGNITAKLNLSGFMPKPEKK